MSLWSRGDTKSSLPADEVICIRSKFAFPYHHENSAYFVPISEGAGLNWQGTKCRPREIGSVAHKGEVAHTHLASKPRPEAIRSYIRPNFSANVTDFRQFVRARSRLYRSRFFSFLRCEDEAISKKTVKKNGIFEKILS